MSIEKGANSFSPVQISEELNSQFQMRMENAQYFTMCFGVVDLKAREFRYVTAGNPPLVVARSNGATEIRVVEGFPIGIVENPGYSECLVELEAGDRVFVYTDGVIEAEDADEMPYGTERLASDILEGSARNLDDCVESILAKVRKWEGGRGLNDDFSILAFELAK